MGMSIQLIKNRSDIGAGTRGSDLGIDALEIAAINSGNDFFHKHDYVDVPTRNETIYHKKTNTFAKRIEHVAEQCERVALAVQASLKAGHTPIVLSGDHSSALGTISGIKAAFPDNQLGVIWIDAHSDIHSPYTSPSGNIHGMPLAAALAEDNLSCQINYPEKSTIDLWERLKNIGCPEAKIVPEHLIYYGLRDFESAEDEFITQKNIRVFTVAETREITIADCVNTTKELLKNCDLVYISFDVDSMDCNAVSHGTGTPVPNGFFPEEIKELLSQLIHALPITCLEVAEINPLLDTKGNFMAETAFQLLESATRQMEG
ncbi:MAG: arginase [Chitinophagaceae bacterium]|nr:arginase [Chitinophagaceae bacterium]MCA6477290.1 arginase [Chitinophagaceae bacterium]MCA6496269.1 arginase [Chitinophagaceae bacterium]